MNHLSSLLKPSVCFKKATAFVVVFTFIVTNHFSLQPLYAQNEISDGLAVANLDLNQLRIPSNIGKLEESWVGDKNKVVVLVQDAHAIPEAQKIFVTLLIFSINATAFRMWRLKVRLQN